MNAPGSGLPRPAVPLTPFDMLRTSGKRGPLMALTCPFVVSMSNHVNGHDDDGV
jgi:hypothetical protein